MKSSVALLATFLALGTGADIFAQDSGHAVNLPTGGGYTNTGIGTTSQNAGSGQPANNTPSSVDGDDTVVRMKTQDSLAAGAMSRDEGQLTRKLSKKEKVSVVDSTKKLQTSGTDPKFQSSLLNSSLTSIADVSAKPSRAAEGQGQVQEQGQAPAQGVTRSLRHKIFVTENNGDSKKNETAQAKADSSPSSSPSPSPSASPDAAHR
jgi:hypothetical protein